jgi:hypothetical protein
MSIIKASKPKYKKGLDPATTTHYIEFGKFMINLRILDKGELLTKYKTSYAPTQIKRRHVSKLFESVLQNIFDTQEINYDLVQDMAEDEQELFKTLIQKAGLTSVLHFDPRKIEPSTKALVDKFNVLKGEIVAGNDNVLIKNDLKKVTTKLFDKEVIDEEKLNEILEIINNI